MMIILAIMLCMQCPRACTSLRPKLLFIEFFKNSNLSVCLLYCAVLNKIGELFSLIVVSNIYPWLGMYLGKETEKLKDEDCQRKDYKDLKSLSSL